MQLHKTQEPIAVSDADITSSTFTNTNIADAVFDDVNLRSAKFNNVNLAGATLHDINLSNVSISNANLKGMHIHRVAIAELLDAKRRASAVIYAKDLDRMRSFYEGLAGFSVEHSAKDHLVLSCGTSKLVLVRVPDAVAASIEITNPPKRRTDNPVKLIFGVSSIADTRDAAPKLGGELLPAEREWEFDGARVCDGFDPEGNVVQFQQRG